MPKHTSSLGKVACLALFFVVAFSVVASAQAGPNEAYENQQRAIRLLQFDKEISSILEPELRIPLRYSILEFIYTKEVRSQYVAAEPLLMAFFEDVKTREKALAGGSVTQKNQMGLLLRKHNREAATAIETKYMFEPNTSEDDLKQFQTPADPTEVADRAIANLRKYGYSVTFTNLYERIRRGSPELGSRMMVATLEYVEKDPTPVNAMWLNRVMVDVLNPPQPVVAAEQMLRYYKVLVTAARSELSRAYPKDKFIYTDWPLRRALPDIEKADPRLAAQAKTVVAAYRRLIPNEQVPREEADDRIEAAEDKVAQATAEAESAATIELKDYFWSRASGLSMPKREGSYKQAVDLLMKASPSVGTSDPKSRDQRISSIADRAASWRDHDGAKYAVDLIKDEQIRALALLNYANNLGGTSLDDRRKAATIAEEALQQIEKTGPIRFTVCEIGNTRSLLMQDSKHSNLHDLTARTVRIMNQFPSNVTNSKIGTPERSDFVKLSANSMIGCSAYIFRPIWPGQSLAPNADLASEIKVKEWRLAAQIEAERYRAYPTQQ